MTKWFVSVALFAAPAITLFARNGQTFLAQRSSVPNWLCAGSSGLVLGLVGWIALDRWRRHARSNRRWTWKGLEWELTPQFWGNIDVYPVHTTLIETVLRGPFCQQCKRPIELRNANGREPCPHGCGETFDLEGVGASPIPQPTRNATELVRLVAYQDAIGEARRGVI